MPLILFIALAGPGPAQVPAALPPRVSAEAFFQPTDFTQPRLSPDGSKACALNRFDETHYQLILIDMNTLKAKVILKTTDMSVVRFWWKTDDLLLTLVSNNAGSREFQSLDLRTLKVTTLGDIRSYWKLTLLNQLPDDPERMLFGASFGANTDLITINLRSGREQTVEDDPGGTTYWLTNRSGMAVAAWGQHDNCYFLLRRSGTAGKWLRHDYPPDRLPDIVPMGVAPDQRRLIVQDFRRDSTSRIRLYDPTDETMEDLAPARPMEPDGLMAWGSTNEPAAIVYEDERQQFHFLTPEAEQMQRWLQTKLPGIETSFASFSRDNSRVIIFANNDRNPGVYLVLDQATKKLVPLGICYRSINPLKWRQAGTSGLPAAMDSPSPAELPYPAE